jgi:hypothetical protein
VAMVGGQSRGPSGVEAASPGRGGGVTVVELGDKDAMVVLRGARMRLPRAC